MTLFSINLELFKRDQTIKNALGVRKSIREVENKHSKQELVDSVEAYKTVIGKKSDFAHDSKEPARFANRRNKTVMPKCCTVT